MPADLKSNKKLTTDRKVVVFLLGFTLVNGWLIDKKPAVNYLWSNIFKLQLFHRLTWILIERLRAQTDRRWFRSYLLGCFVKCFYFVWSKTIITSSCQKCPGEGVSIVVPAWWAVSMAKVGTGTATGWRVFANANVTVSTENRFERVAVVYGVSVRTMLPCLRQFHRCPSWFVNQREKKCLGIISPPGATSVTCWENKKRKMLIEIQTLM